MGIGLTTEKKQRTEQTPKCVPCPLLMCLVQALQTQKLSNVLGSGVCLDSLVPCSDCWYPVCSYLYVCLVFINSIINVVSRDSPLAIDVAHTETKPSLHM